MLHREREGEIIVMPEGETGGKLSMRNPKPLGVRPVVKPAGSKVRARILWPALGFPAVVSPREKGSDNQFINVNATRCICVLLLSDRPELSKAEAARYLRYTPWNVRERRHIAAGADGSFKEEELAIRNDVKEPKKLTMPGRKDGFSVTISFGGDEVSRNGITVNLSRYVLDFYNRQGLKYLHEIRVYEWASRKLQEGQYQLFWNNELPNEKTSSDELKLLLQKFARPRREALGDWERQNINYLMAEYEFEWGTMQKPYKNLLAMRQYRTEVLHPLFIQRQPVRDLRISHVTDTHVDVRADVYEQNLKEQRVTAVYNNWNQSFVNVYDGAKRDGDVVFMTGDLIDYGRGHFGLQAVDRLGQDELYHVDRNWFLFYYLLTTKSSYCRPVYTILGNHDWRLNPYPPFAMGAPGSDSFFHNHRNYTKEQLDNFLRQAHGRGSERKFSYYQATDDEFVRKFWDEGGLIKAVAKAFAQRQNMSAKHLPLETTIESVAWYLMIINPFFDYSASLPGGHSLLMLDWAKEENVLFPIVEDGKEWPYMLWQLKKATGPGPKARNCLTGLQKKLTEEFISSPGKAKIIGIHAPVIGPYPDWYDYPDLFTEQKIYGPGEKNRAKRKYALKRPDGKIENLNGHPIFATRPSGADDDFGTTADYGSFERERPWLVKALARPESGVKVVLSGHIHRNGLFVVQAPQKGGDAVAGKLLVHGLLVSNKPSEKMVMNLGRFPYRFPLYVNTTSTGLRGNFNLRKLTEAEKKGTGISMDPGYAQVVLTGDGILQKVSFLFPPISVNRTAGTACSRPAEAPARLVREFMPGAY